jgi:nicotinamide-nucleotide amidase
MQAIVLSIGSELTLGQSVDTNSAWLSARLAEIGIPVRMHLTLPDELELICQEIARACGMADVLLITGGLGPTADDLTRLALAAVMGTELVEHQPCVEQIRAFFAARRREMPEANLVQAMLPAGSVPLENTCGTAPGIRATLTSASQQTTIFALPGVPREMKVMYERSVRPELAAQTGGAVILARTLYCCGAGESLIGERIVDLMQQGRNPSVGTTARQGVIGVHIRARAASPGEAAGLLQATADEVRSRLGDLVFGEDDPRLEAAVARLLVQHRLTIATAESCTGGQLARRLTDIPGSSAYFREGLVTYANEAKMRLLSISEDVLEQHGAVSAAVADAMAVRCRRQSGADLAISITGIAGPTGGTSEKPVGLVYIGLAAEEGCVVTDHHLGDDLTREEIRERTCTLALNRLRLRLMETSARRESV